MTLPVDGNLDFQNVNKVINLPTPTNTGDAASKSYVDAMAQGVIFKAAVQAASVGANVSITAPGATLDGVTLTNGMRILLKDQTTASQNGLWIWNGASSALTRPTDFATTSSQAPGTSVFVEQGTVNVDQLFTIIATANITVDTTSEVWSQTSGAADITVSAPLTKTGNAIGLPTLPVANGGTGSTTASGARNALSATGKYATTIGDGATTTFTVNHNLGTTDVTVNIYDMATGNMELVPYAVTGVNSISVGAFGTAPAAAGGTIGSGTGKRVVVTG